MSRQVVIVLEDEGMDGTYWTARHAITVAIKHHESAVRNIDRNKGRTMASVRARRTHEDALTHLKALQGLVVNARSDVIAKEGGS